MNTYRLPEETHAALLSRTTPAGRPLDAWPLDAPDDTTDSLLTACLDITRRLREKEGWLVVDTGLADLDDEQVTSAVWNLFTVLCRPVPQYRTGELMYPVEVTAAPTLASSHYSSSSRTGGFHTDGTLLDTTPDVAMLAGLSTADEGGETVLVDVEGLVAALTAQAPQHLDVLAEPHPFHSGDSTDDPVMLHRILTRTDSGTQVRYLRRYVEQGYLAQGQTIGEGLTEALDAWDALVARPDYQEAVLIGRGQVLLWDNFRFVHGRTPFTERLHRRRLRRGYGVLRAA
ncbi:TauD/TfdA family dioxygenase [Streptomyces sp. NPDC126499]|uniref:TauD/TfdA family dioxygenase n=1 Tax=Streptomyces sp. NPDC126499 TaxID=3155314 RepID=UPI00332B24C8